MRRFLLRNHHGSPNNFLEDHKKNPDARELSHRRCCQVVLFKAAGLSQRLCRVISKGVSAASAAFVCTALKGPSKKAEASPGHHQEGFAKLARRSDLSPLRDGVLTLTDANGKPIDGVKPEALADGVNPKSIAGRLTRQRWNETRSGFNRQLDYQLLGVA